MEGCGRNAVVGELWLDGCDWRVAEEGMLLHILLEDSISQVIQCFLTLPELSWDCTLYHPRVHAQSHSRVQLFVTPWNIARQAPLSMEFSRQEYWSWLPFTTPGDLPNPGTEPASLASPALAGRF